MLTISGFRGANRVGVEGMARTVGLDMISVVAVGHDDDVAVRRRWSVRREVSWLAKKDEMIPRA